MEVSLVIIFTYASRMDKSERFCPTELSASLSFLTYGNICFPTHYYRDNSIAMFLLSTCNVTQCVMFYMPVVVHMYLVVSCVQDLHENLVYVLQCGCNIPIQGNFTIFLAVTGVPQWLTVPQMVYVQDSISHTLHSQSSTHHWHWNIFCSEWPIMY